MVVSASNDQTIRIWDARTGRVISGPLSGHTNWVTSVSFSPDSKRVISTSDDFTIRVWDARTGITALGPLKDEPDVYFQCAAFHPSGERLLSLSKDGTIQSWNAKTGVLMTSSHHLKLRAPLSRCASFSQDCSFVVSGSRSGCVSLVNILPGESVAEPLTMQGHTKAIKFIAVSPDSRQVASAGSRDCTVRIWYVGG